MGKATDTRQRMIQSAALLLREKGAASASFPNVLEHADAPRGSLSHHFPGGKREMVAEAVTWAGGLATSAMQGAAARGQTPRQIVAQVIAFYRAQLEPSGYRAACPVAAVANGSFDDDQLREAVEQVFGDWRSTLTAALVADGRSDDEAAELADLAIASVEGALMLCRVDRSAAALDRVAAALDRQLTT